MTSNQSAQLLILSDDLTGALDAGVQLTHQGRHVVINTDCQQACPPDADVIVIDTETRHLTKEAAYDIVYHLVNQAWNSGVRHIYKKTDSGLRGNVGAELSAALDATKVDHLNFIPAWPQMNRVTKKGIHYVNDTPLAESIFAKDPIDPVTTSKISDLIHQQSSVAVMSGTTAERNGIVVYDAETEKDLEKIAQSLEAKDDLKLVAGCAGFLEKYPNDSINNQKQSIPVLPQKLIVLSGSVNVITKMQLDDAEQNGAPRYHIPLKKILKGQWDDEEKQKFVMNILSTSSQAPVIIIDTLAEKVDELASSSQKITTCIDQNMGSLANIIKNMCSDRVLMIIGGDTLHGMIVTAELHQIYPVMEIDSGVVLAKYIKDNKEQYIITKSGGFGKKELLTNIVKVLER